MKSPVNPAKVTSESEKTPRTAMPGSMLKEFEAQAAIGFRMPYTSPPIPGPGANSEPSAAILTMSMILPMIAGDRRFSTVLNTTRAMIALSCQNWVMYFNTRLKFLPPGFLLFSV